MFKKRVSKFLMAGLLATSVSYISFPIFYEYLFHGEFNISFISSTFFNITFSFVLQRYFVFRSNGHIFYEYLRFFSSALLIIGVAYFSLKYLVNSLNIQVIYANFMIVTASAVISYLMHSFITFRSK